MVTCGELPSPPDRQTGIMEGFVRLDTPWKVSRWNIIMEVDGSDHFPETNR